MKRLFDSGKEKGVNPHLIVLEAVESPENNKRGPRLRRRPFTLLSVLIENFHVSKTEIKASYLQYFEESQIYLKTAFYRPLL